MSFPDVLKRGNDFLNEYPRQATWWNYALHATCLAMIFQLKALLHLLYKPQVHNIEKLDAALARARAENRLLLTVMNHMSVVDDPLFFALLPFRFHSDIDTVRWGFGAHNICFSTPTLLWFFNFGKILGTKRFGEGPFQGSLDAAIRILSPDDTLDLEFPPWARDAEKPALVQEMSALALHGTHLAKNAQRPETQTLLKAQNPIVRTKTSWFHVFPEGFVLQLEEPHSNLMRYFKWGVSRLILEATRTPVVVPMFASGFEKVAPEDADGISRWLPQNLGAEIHLTIGDPVPDEHLELYRKEWRKLCRKYTDPQQPTDLSPELRDGKKAQRLRSDLAAFIREHVAAVRLSTGFHTPEDPRFKSPAYWKEYTRTEGLSDRDVKFIGKNWAIKRLQKHLPEYDDSEDE